MDIATRVWNHKWKIDPIVRSLIDTDFYKLLMCQSVFRNKPDTEVTFSLINRTKTIRWPIWWTKANCANSSTTSAPCR